MSGALDEDTAKTLASGRASIASILSAAQQNLKRAFVVFLVFWIGSFYALRVFVWDRLKTDLVYNLMNEEVREATEIVATTPFEVILLQVKIGVIVGILGTLPVLVYFSRDSLRRRGYWPSSSIPKWKIWGFAVAIVVLLLGGMSYAYFLFFPIMFDFLAANAVQSGFKPTWSIALWTEFIFFLALSFGLAAQLPLAMSSVARAGIIPYETFRDKWRYAVVGIFVFGAMFSPPDPFTQVMWGVPLVLLYFISLGVTKFAVLSKQAGEEVSTKALAKQRWNVLAGGFALTVGAAYMFWIEGGNERANDLLDAVGSNYRLLAAEEFAFGLPPTAVAVAAGSVIGLAVAAVLLFYFRIKALEDTTAEADIEAALAGELEEEETSEEEPEPAPDPGDPATVGLGSMSAKAVETVPLEEFARFDQETVLGYARQAVDADNPEKARALMDRFEDAQEVDAADEDEEDILTSTTTGVVDAFTDEETDEDDIGGYYYDIAFILDSLTSRAIWIVATFMVVMAGSFMFLYTGGIETVQDIFFRNIPDQVQGQAQIVTLHPVEALIFMLKFSTLLGFVSVIPIALYFAWPAVEDRGFSTGGNRNVLLLWGGVLTLAMFGGILLGFLYIAPTVISLLATDVINSNMVIAYRINSFGWLVIYLTVGIGLLAMIPTTMILFHHGNIVGYRRMRKSWRGVVLAFFAAAGLLSPSGIFTMFLVAIPAGLCYGFGLFCLWIYEGVGRRVPLSRSKTAD